MPLYATKSMQSSLNSAVNRFKRLAILTSVTCPRSKNNITPRMDTKSLNALPKTKVRFIEAMYVLAIQKLPQGQEWLYEVKFDGYRCLAGIDASGVTLWSRRGNLFTNQFPHCRCVRTASTGHPCGRRNCRPG